MLYIVVPVVVVAFLLLCCYGGYGNYEYRQKKLLSENQEEHEVGFEGYSQKNMPGFCV
jgi:hypothetical protein